MARMDEGSVDSVVTDPPYGLEFMGKDWDGPSGFRRAGNPADVGRESVFGRLSRTSPESSAAWQGGAGFSSPGIGERQTPWPSHTGCSDQFGGANPTCAKCGGRARGKKKCGCEEPDWKVKGSAPDPMFSRLRQMAQYQEWCQSWATEMLRILRPGGYALIFGGTRTYHRLTCAVEDAGFEVRDCIMWIYGSGFPKAESCLKPSYEPILLCRKPGPKALPLGIDACRIETDEIGLPREYRPREDRENWRITGGTNGNGATSPLGRWPANVIHDGSDEVMEAFAEFGETTSGAMKREVPAYQGDSMFLNGRSGPSNQHGDSGTVARFFYCAKASRSERGDGNTHPTVKPLALMRWLCKLVTPKGGIVLDPFAGSGTTGRAAIECGFRFIGIELQPEYIAIAKTRLAEPLGVGDLFGPDEVPVIQARSLFD